MKKTTTLSKMSTLFIVLLTCGAMTAQITNYGIYIAGTELTSDNAGAINNTNFPSLGLAEGGTITYDHSEKTFTLTGVTANVDSARFMRISDSAEKADYTINLVGTNAITNNGGTATIATYRNLIVEGSGSLKVTSDDCGILIYNDTLTIKNTTVEAKGVWGFVEWDGSSGEHLIIENSNVTATGARGSICDLQSITLTNCKIIQPEGAINDGSSVTLDGSVVTSEVKISPTTGLSTLAAEGIYVWGEKGVISIEIPFLLKGESGAKVAHIYNVSGILVRTLPLQGTEGQVAVPAGIYIVKIGNAIEKVVVR
ncbi:MAG: hypothetical protein BWX65_00112 [Bacteroidetes bacterium ADurb.Bin057]|nr:MAG: hypothetical protein BWX65_00112 [Bacteroidetes bacterium ADurb.Bin057]